MVEAALAAWDRTGRADPDPQSLQAMMASVATSAAALGLDEVRRTAGDLAALLALPRGSEDGAGASSRLHAGLAAVRLAAARVEGASALAGDREESVARPRRLLLSFGEDAEAAAELAFQLGCFGFLVRSVREPRELVATLPHAAAVILDVDVLADSGAVPQVLDAVVAHRSRNAEAPPLVVISPRTDLEARLRAVRLGADAFLPRGADVHELVEQVDALVAQQPQSPYRVLLVDDDYGEALPRLLTLQASGMEVEVAIGAMEGLRRLPDLEPDVLVAPLDLAGCSGAELAAVIRQERERADLPVVLLAPSRDLARRLEAVRRGGHDVLVMPVSGEELLLSVRHHAQRHRLLRHFRTRDGLTGLLDFTSAMAALRHECRRSSETGRPLLLALADVDRLGEINRRYGHLAGDAVLRCLADLLRQRFRRTDVLGRYANRIVVVLPDTGSNGIRILEELRAVFGEIRHRNRAGTFTATLSCGVVQQRPGQSPSDLLEAAQAALVRARAIGGDRLELAAE